MSQGCMCQWGNLRLNPLILKAQLSEFVQNAERFFLLSDRTGGAHLVEAMNELFFVASSETIFKTIVEHVFRDRNSVLRHMCQETIHRWKISALGDRLENRSVAAMSTELMKGNSQYLSLRPRWSIKLMMPIASDSFSMLV